MRMQDLEARKNVELIPAFVWDCHECGTENFSRTIVAEFTPEEMGEMKLIHGIDPLEDGLFLTSPATVKCKFCRSEYGTTHFGEEE